MNIKTISGEQIHAEKLGDAILDGVVDGVYFVDRNRRILFWNKAAEELTGYKANQVIGTSCADGILMHVDEKGNCLCKDGCPLAAIMQDGISRETHVFMHHADGHRVPVHVRGGAIYDSHGSIIGSVELFSDDRERIGTLERLRDMEQAALIDELTGLANRRYFNRAFDACQANFERKEEPFGLILIDVDHFKQFNDIYGHDVGDAVLQMIAQTLTHNCRPYDAPTRWGGEEFMVLSEHVNEDALYTVAERLRVLTARSSLTLNETPLNVTISVGATMVRPGDNTDSIIKRVDVNLYESKEGGRNRTTMDRSACTCNTHSN